MGSTVAGRYAVAAVGLSRTLGRTTFGWRARSMVAHVRGEENQEIVGCK
jgi:hypothetical protein